MEEIQENEVVSPKLKLMWGETHLACIWDHRPWLIETDKAVGAPYSDNGWGFWEEKIRAICNAGKSQPQGHLHWDCHYFPWFPS